MPINFTPKGTYFKISAFQLHLRGVYFKISALQLCLRGCLFQECPTPSSLPYTQQLNKNFLLFFGWCFQVKFPIPNSHGRFWIITPSLSQGLVNKISQSKLSQYVLSDNTPFDKFVLMVVNMDNQSPLQEILFIPIHVFATCFYIIMYVYNDHFNCSLWHVMKTLIVEHSTSFEFWFSHVIYNMFDQLMWLKWKTKFTFIFVIYNIINLQFSKIQRNYFSLQRYFIHI